MRYVTVVATPKKDKKASKRVCSLTEIASKSESLTEARQRAFGGATLLKELATNSEVVLLVGHGIVNRFIAKELLSTGWHGPANPGTHYWEFGIYDYST